MRTAPRTTAADLVREGFEFSPAVIQTTKEFARDKPWQGTIDERKAKFQAFHEKMLVACELTGEQDVSVTFGDLTGDSSLQSRYKRRSRNINLTGKLSVVTYLNLLAAAQGMTTRDCFRWSLCLFAARFPRSFANCQQRGVFLVR